MTSENVAEQDAVESAMAVSAKAVDDQLIDELVSRAQAQGLQLTGEGGLLQQLTKRLLESALEGEITDHLGLPSPRRPSHHARTGWQPPTICQGHRGCRTGRFVGPPGAAGFPPPFRAAAPTLAVPPSVAWAGWCVRHAVFGGAVGAEDWMRFRARRATGPAGPVPIGGPTGTASGGGPATGAAGEAWLDRMRALLWSAPPAEAVQEKEEELRHAGRVLDIALRMGELLLASGQGAEDVEAAMLGVTRAYGLARCEPQVTFTMLSVSYHAGELPVPLTAARTVRRRAADHSRLDAVHRLVGLILAGDLPLEAAAVRLAAIRARRGPYASWVLSAAAGALAGSATLLVGGRWGGQAMLAFVTAFAAAWLGDRLALWLARASVPEFYQFLVGAVPASASGVLLAAAGAGLQGSFVITGGLFALLPGRAVVAGVEDGLTGFYLTAGARLLEVLYLVTGIVLGVLAVVPLGHYLGAKLHPEEILGRSSLPVLQLAAAFGLSVSLAVLLQCPRRTVAVVAANGAVGWAVFGSLTEHTGLGPVTATGVAAGMVGLFGQLLSRRRGTTSLLYVTAALGPLLPGSAVYRGLLGFAQGRVDAGLDELSRAGALALALAVGVHAGRELSRLSQKVPVYAGRPRDAARRTRGY